MPFQGQLIIRSEVGKTLLQHHPVPNPPAANTDEKTFPPPHPTTVIPPPHLTPASPRLLQIKLKVSPKTFSKAKIKTLDLILDRE